MTLTRYFLCLLFTLVSGLLANAQSPNTNYVKVYKAQKAIVGDLSLYPNKEDVAVSIVYHDGLGREAQSVAKQQSPLGKDIISFSTYDGYGQKNISYLPYVANQTNGALIADPMTDQKAFYISLFGTVNGNVALSESVIEHSELSRVIEQAAPGDDWKVGSGHTITKKSLTNTSSDAIRRFIYNSNGSLSIAQGTEAFYEERSLNSTKTTDEQGNDVLEFVDKEGHTICKKVKAPGGVYASTYYVYDDLGNLVVVLPPEAVERVINSNGN